MPNTEGEEVDRLDSMAPLHLDGTTLEGGGQLLRVALSLSALYTISIHVTQVC